MRWQLTMFVLCLGCVSAQVRTDIADSLRLSERRALRVGGAEAAPTLRDASRARLIALALANDPGVRARGHRARALAHAARAEASRPPPELGAQIWNLPLTRPWALGEANMYMIELRGSLPPAGVLTGRSRAMLAEAQEALADIADRERTVARRVSDVHASYVASARRLAVHRAHVEQVEAMREAVRARYETARATLADVSRVEVERARLMRVVARDEAELTRARRSLNVLVQRDPDAPLDPATDTAASLVDGPLEAFLARAEQRPEAERARARARAEGHRAQAAHAEAVWPAFTLGGSYWQMPGDRPGIGASASMTLPWLSGAAPAREREARERVLAEGDAECEAVLDGRAEIASAYGQMQAVARELAVLLGASREAAHEAVEAARAGYITGRTDLLTWIDDARAALDVETDEIELTRALAESVSALEWAVGAPLPRRPLVEDRGTP